MNPTYNLNSLVAYFGTQPRIGNKQRDVLMAIMELGACSDREICDHLKQKHPYDKWEINKITNRRGELLNEKKLIVKADGNFYNEYNYRIDKWKLNPNYKIEAQNRTIDKFRLPKTQEALPMRKVRYFVTMPDGTKKEV